MIVMVYMKNVIRRGETYCFRMRVPKDCVEQVGKKEIIYSLKTKNDREAQAAAEEMTQAWTAKFKRIRTPLNVLAAKKAGIAVADVPEPSFRQQLIDQMKKNLPAILDKWTEESLNAMISCYSELIRRIQQNDRTRPHAVPELGTSWPFTPPLSPGQDRRRSRDLIEVLTLLCEVVANEMVSPPIKQETPQEKNKRAVATAKEAPGTASTHEQSITAVVELMIAAKKLPEKTAVGLRADVKLLKEWCGGKDSLPSYTKRDMIDFMQNALPYLPSNMNKKKDYTGKTVRECVALTKSDLKTYKPISYRTCENRQASISTVFNYAKDHLGLIAINPARDIEIPKIRVTAKRVRGYSPQELTAMWAALQTVKEEVAQKPSRYWATILSLYHGFRLNEICSLFLKDVYEDKDGVFVIDINEDGPLKSVKNPSSVRVVPVHPFVRDQLGFKEFVAEQKSARSDGVLFTDVRGTEKNGYIRQTSFWFAGWKRSWLPADTQYKHFHDLRYTFTQNAQNVAKMPDRHAQEITGHSIEGVSVVHLSYSGRLKPAALLEELQKVKYGWETVQEAPGQ